MAHLVDTRRRRSEAIVDSDVAAELGAGGSAVGRWVVLVVVVCAFAVWEWSGRSGLISPLLLPPPSAIWRALIRSTTHGLLDHLLVTLGRVFAGIVLGAIPALTTGWAIGWSPRLRSFVDPLIALLHPIPKITLLPIIMVLFGLGEQSKVIVIALGVFFPLVLTSMAGVRQIHASLFDIAQVYGATRLQTFAHVVLPGSLPMVLTGLRLAFNIALLITISIELLIAQKGLGKMIWLSWQTMRIDDLFAALAVIASLGVGFNVFLNWLTARIVPWYGERAR